MLTVLSPQRANTRLAHALSQALSCSIAVFLWAISCIGCASTTNATSDAPASSSTSTAQLGLVHDASTLSPGKYALIVFGMSCPKCISNVDLQLSRIAGITNPKVDMKHGVVAIDVVGPAEPTREAVFQAILDAGFTLREIRKIPHRETQP